MIAYDFMNLKQPGHTESYCTQQNLVTKNAFLCKP